MTGRYPHLCLSFKLLNSVIAFPALHLLIMNIGREKEEYMQIVFTCCLFFLRVVVLDKVTDFILFLGQLTITAGLGKSHVYLLNSFAIIYAVLPGCFY